MFYRRQQQAGESLDQYATALRQLADWCDFTSITPDEVLRDCLASVMDVCVRHDFARMASRWQK